MAEHSDRISAECEQLKVDINRLGSGGSVAFGVLFDDDDVQQYYEALVGTLKAAKKRGIVDFKGQMLLKGAHDSVMISFSPLPTNTSVTSSMSDLSVDGSGGGTINTKLSLNATPARFETPDESAKESGGEGGGDGGGGVYYKLEELVKDVPKGVDKSRKEDYLCDVDFDTVLGMGREEWGKIAKWKKQQIKKKVGIF
ncbi:hypothetical protein TrCOL_g13504 [Triparma columacea]|uniref:HP domain-containing protein n=1 Tax=Triparma columacea TaxID=722753 RepID=A0A9W7FW19_9STRA|nr:hypothetical protein TrCOL_g13504 [Triparma columacea]